MASTITSEELYRRLDSLARGKRHLVAIAGAPGAGKSTLAEVLVDRLNASDPGRAAVLPMDGYHFDDRVLTARGRLARKGAPDTFDVDGLASMLARLRANEAVEIAVPVFDRTIEIARAGAALIARTTDIVVIEGNYLLSDEPPWSTLDAMYDLRALVVVDEEELRRRLRVRWVHFGLDEDGIRQKLEENDLPNGRYVYRHSTKVDLFVDGMAA